jgi:serine-type D-Ala-D-Ala carboxypeptidase (penicillin-binding protein 5/6)
MLALSRLAASAVLSLGILAAGVSSAQSGQARYLIDAQTGKVLESDHADELNYPASLTKMMTLYLTFEALHQGRLKWDQKVVMSENANNKEPFKFAVGAGRTITVREAVLGMVVLSTNDAAVLMGETLGGSEAGFGVLMTEKARQLGMSKTVFRNPAGLPDPEQVTTAEDMAKLGLALMRDFPEEFKLFSNRTITFRGMKLRGHNGVLNAYPGASGIKTGYTDASGYNLVTSVDRGGHHLVGVVLGGKSAGQRDADMMAMMDRHLPAAPVAQRPAAKAVAEPVSRPVQKAVAQPVSRPASIHEAAVGKP